MEDVKNKGGRPFLTVQQKTNRKELLLIKIQPYLMTGLSVDKALKASQIHNSEFYKYMKEDRLFGEKVASYKTFIPVLVCKIFFTELVEIAKRQAEGQSLSKGDRNFVWWFALHSNLTMEEYGRKIKDNAFDPEEEIQRLYGLFDN